MTGSVAAGRVDGRTARAERTRRAIVEAHLALLSEGDVRPTGERIAERAGISLRTLWINFKDMETLFEASGAAVLERQDAAYRPVPTDQPLRQRVDAYCGQRAELIQMFAPIFRAAAMREPISPQLHRNRVKHIERVRREVEELFAPELELAGPAAGELVDALVAASMWPAWSMLRDGLGLDAEAALRAMTRTVSALLVTAIAASVGPPAS
jgi:TetR/AcrR family transcriptional regulator of autoinduction and epiphytic fitness